MAMYRARRESLGLTQTEVAERMGLTTQGTISEHERSVNSATIALLRRWAAALDCELHIVLWPKPPTPEVGEGSE